MAQIVLFGEVVYDRFPDGSEVLGGAPLNVAWNLCGLGASPLLISRVGDDDLGRRVRNALDDWGLDLSGLQLDPRHGTGTVEVSIRGGEPSFEIVEDRAWDHIDQDELPDGLEADILYLGTLASRKAPSRRAARRLLELGSRTRFLDVNLRPPHWNRSLVDELVECATDLKVNEKEVEEIARAGSDEIESALEWLRSSHAERVWLTKGERGASAIRRDGSSLQMPIKAPATVVDTVGAGDAFSAIVLLGRMHSWTLEVTLARATELASSVVGLRGATTDERSFYERFRSRWGLP